MIPRLSTAALLCAGMLLALSACSRPLPPEDVADRFWRAVTAQSAGKIRRYVRAADRAALAGDPSILPVSSHALGRIVIEGDEATVETEVTLDGDHPVTVNVDTVLVREDAHWRVDYEATVDDISTQSELARVIDQIENFGDALKDGIDKSVDEMKRVVPEIEKQISRIESEIEQRVPELRERLEEFSKQIEEALKLPPAEETPTEPPSGPIEI